MRLEDTGITLPTDAPHMHRTTISKVWSMLQRLSLIEVHSAAKLGAGERDNCPTPSSQDRVRRGSWLQTTDTISKQWRMLRALLLAEASSVVSNGVGECDSWPTHSHGTRLVAPDDRLVMGDATATIACQGEIASTHVVGVCFCLPAGYS